MNQLQEIPFFVGGFAFVFVAQDVASGKEYALKVLFLNDLKLTLLSVCLTSFWLQFAESWLPVNGHHGTYMYIRINYAKKYVWSNLNVEYLVWSFSFISIFQRLLASDEEKNKAVMQEITILVSFKDGTCCLFVLFCLSAVKTIMFQYWHFNRNQLNNLVNYILRMQDWMLIVYICKCSCFVLNP